MKEEKDHIKWNKLVSSQLAVWEVRHQLRQRQRETQTSGPWSKAFITFSRTHGAGGDHIAKELGKILDWQVYDRELVEYIAKNANVRHSVVESFDERKQSEIERWVQTLFDNNALGTDKYLKHLSIVLVTIAEHGQAIIIGRGGNFVLGSNKGLRVLVTAPILWRAGRLAKIREITIKEAKKIIIEVDNSRQAYIKRYFSEDANDPANYDIVLNVENLSVHESAKTLLAIMEQRLGTSFPALASPVI